MKRPAAVIDGVARALRPGGRFVGEFGGKDNVAVIRAGLRLALAGRRIDAEALCPWYFPDEAEYATRLEMGGFAVERIERFARPTPLPGSMADWLETFAEAYLQAVPAADPGREELIVYRVRPGETLWEIAAALTDSPLNYRTLMELNGIESPPRLRAGQDLLVPVRILKDRPSGAGL